MMKDFVGKLFPAVPCLFDEAGNLDEDANLHYAEYMSGAPVDGVAVWVHTGRGLFLNEHEREKVFSIWRRKFRDKIVIAGAGADSDVFESEGEDGYIERAVKMANMAKDLGADALLIFPPKPFEDHGKKVIKYHEEISSVELPMILFYLYPEAGGVEYDFEILERLLGMKWVIGIKLATLYSVVKMQDISNFVVEKFPNKVLITGEDRMFGYSLIRGAKSALIGLGSVLPNIQREMMNAYFEKDYDRFVKLMITVDKIAESLFVDPMEGYIERIEYMLYLLGIVPRKNVFDPHGPGIHDGDKERIRKVLVELGYL
ncbi:MAG TPA: dihydrodipicolinate synthase family protein [Thermotogales bacterium]|nr:dihydrodipicolinate synthase family protein [Thermotogales bacterium]